jgi:N-methylhydantoinase B
MLGAARIGEKLVLALGEEVGWDVLSEHTSDWFDYSEKRMVSSIRNLPSGTITVSGGHDPFPGVPDGIPINVTVSVDAEDARIEVDLRDNLDCQPCGLNLTEATARTAAMMGIFYSLHPTVPPNAGSARRLMIHLRENCVVGIPRHPASCSVATTALADRVTNCVGRAVAELADGYGLAEAGLVNPPVFAVISGQDPRHEGAPFVNQLILSGLTGGPAGPQADGWLMLASIGSAGVPFRDSVELDELRFPMLIEAQHIIPDSEGAGRFCGAPGAYCEYGPVDGELNVLYTSDGTLTPARGVRGGLDGAPARQLRRDVAGNTAELDACGHVLLAPGERVISISCGAGGYGNPHERDPEAVRTSVTEGWITPERAKDVFGVVLDAAGAVDTTATDALRAPA